MELDIYIARVLMESRLEKNKKGSRDMLLLLLLTEQLVSLRKCCHQLVTHDIFLRTVPPVRD